jgi:hypothetical protein
MNVHWEITEPLVFFRGRYYGGMTAAVELTEPIETAEPVETAETVDSLGSVENVR